MLIKRGKALASALAVCGCLSLIAWHELSVDPLNRWWLQAGVAGDRIRLVRQLPSVTAANGTTYTQIWVQQGAGGSTGLLVKACLQRRCKTALFALNDVAPKMCMLGTGEFLISTSVSNVDILYPKPQLVKEFENGGKLFSLGTNYGTDSLLLVRPTERSDVFKLSTGRLAVDQLSIPCRLPVKG
jgi:hypothetical protein